MLPTQDGFLVGESRDEQKKQVRFFCIDLGTGRPLWENMAAEEDWWVGIEAAHGNMVYLHLFARPDMPEHAGIIALDRTSGAVVWQLAGMQLRGAQGEILIVRNGADPESGDVPISALTGEPLPAGSRPGGDAGNNASAFGDPEGIIYPIPLSEGEEGWNEFRTVLRDRSLVGACEAARVDDRWIFSYHAAQRRGEPLLEHHLAITDAKGRTLFSDVLHAEAHMPVYDAFFVRDKQVFFIRRERELVCVRMSARKD